MKNYSLKIKSKKRINEKTFLLVLDISGKEFQSHPGQFVNIKINKTNFPLLRRPFSISDQTDDELFIAVDVRGEGTRMLSEKETGETLETLGPLGKGFNVEDDFDSAVFVAGGIGSAPFPFLRKALKGKTVISFIGAGTELDVIKLGLENAKISTDDGSLGFKGNVVELLNAEFNNGEIAKPKIFACGPTPMLKAVQGFAERNNTLCELSLESHMACGFGLCQGCPVEKSDGSDYLLVCKDGPVFNSKEIKL